MADEIEFTEEENPFKLCVLCATDLKDKSPKLLPCLHTLCNACYQTLFQVLKPEDPKLEVSKDESETEKENGDKTETSGGGSGDHTSIDSPLVLVDLEKPATGDKTKKDGEKSEDSFSVSCPACSIAVDKALVIDNLFVNVDADTPIVIDEDEEEKEEVHKCTACDENDEASSFCLDCREWLCDQCVFAHKRVRITKDHSISPKGELKKDDEPPVTKGQKSMFCRTHKHEPLKLFCETCDRLTCRDCQLLEHKDHRYQFMNEAITKQREILQHVVVKVKQKLQNYNQADKILQAKNQELKTKLEDVCDNIRNVTDTLVNEIKSHSDKLVTHLEKYISSKTCVISDKQRLVNDAVFRMRHSVQFVENALTLGDDLSILYTKGSMMKVLDQLSRTGIPFHPSILNYAITFEHEKDFLLKNIIKVGHLVIDGTNYPNAWLGGHVTSQASPVALPSAPFQTTPHSHAPNMTVPHRPPIPGFESVAARVPPNIYNHIKNQVKNYPPEKQREMFQKMVEQYQLRQQQKAIQQFRQQQQLQQQHPPPPGIYGGILSGSNYQAGQVPVIEATRNLNNITNGGMPARAQMSGASSRFPASGAIHNLANMGGTYYNTAAPSRPPAPAGNRNQPPPSYNRPMLPQGMNAYAMQQQNLPKRSTAPDLSGSGGYSAPRSGMCQEASGPTQGGYRQRPQMSTEGQHQPCSPTAGWQTTICDLTNKYLPSTQSGPKTFEQTRSPGAQAASHANQTPSPAGAGFDQSGGASQGGTRVTPDLPLATSSADSGQAVGSVTANSHVKLEFTDFPPCSFSQIQAQSVAPVPLPSQPPPPLVHMKPPVAPVGGGKTMPVPINNDPNEDYCAVCQNGGDLLCCDKCPKVFHIRCHVPELNAYPSGEWSCSLCAKDDDLCLAQKENKEFTIVPGTGKRKAPTGLTDNEIKACERILLELFCHQKSTVFHEPVSKAVPNYYKIITNPIDFGKIKCKLQRQNFNHYNVVDDFIADMLLVFRNCRTYNDVSSTTQVHNIKATSEIWKHGKMVEEEFENLVHRFLPCYVDVLDEERDRPVMSTSPQDPAAKKKRSEDPAVHFS
ncbi:E3 ubiquitin-protein ligase TRIM33-like isoform X2 [Mizuhopecten yessoensis]|uniref:E3 ubiquitin-protein ligase TRIM33-like isoform X2 n=1 Tax=Mizuhopecten yessoensis TaxID=6573 RepID=UPI000B458411|nr:E3 ubiquitin-protein ligase TRIM33-like isoform X2 [Mizuhopecten yessoensis]